MPLEVRHKRHHYGPELMTTLISRGGIQPALISVLHESRAEALKVLALRFNGYWNFEIDCICLERPLEMCLENLDLRALCLQLLRLRGELQCVKIWR